MNTTSMEIYILRDGTQIGPFSEETTQRLLKQGSILLTDLAWQAGSPKWIPLQNVIYPAQAPKKEAAPVIAPPPPPPPVPLPEAKPLPPVIPAPATAVHAAPAAAPTPAANSTPARKQSEPASPRQKAFLNYMGISFADGIGKEEAALLVNEVLEHQKDPRRLARWNEDRLRLHPDLYAAELQAKKDNRAARFFELAETQGEECFDGLSKAHCQVLVGYLDVKFPNWDSNEAEATWNYFYPAVAEKFPDVVRKEWRAKLKYPTGPKVAAELKGPTSGKKATRKHRPSPFVAVLKGASIGAVTIAVFITVLYIAKHPLASPTANTPASSNKATKSEASPAEKAMAFPAAVTGKPRPPRKPAMSSGGTPTSTAASNPAPAAPTAEPMPQTAENSSLFGTPPAPVSSPASPAPAAPMEPAPGDPVVAKEGETPKTTGNASLDSLFGAPNAPTAAATPGAIPATPAATTPAPTRKAEVILTKPVDVPVAFGMAKLPAGTHLRFVAREGAIVKVNYLNQVVGIPAGSTDVGADGP